MIGAGSAISDDFARLIVINRASAVMLRECDVISAADADIVASSIERLEQEAAKPGADRPSDYAMIEKSLMAIGGPRAALVHTGRSRVDINRTSRKMAQREACLAAFRASVSFRQALLAFAAGKTEALLPAYTLGVQAQSTTIGHYVSGYVSALARSSGRLRATFATLNKSPLGAGALATSSFPLDRSRLAELLGFDGPVENSFDAVQLAPLDIGVEILGVAVSAAMTLAQFLADLERQYRFARPWMTIAPGKFTGVSTMMPQKRNPDVVNRLRAGTGDLLGIATGFLFKAHNMPHGMPDYAGVEPATALERLVALLDDGAEMVGALHFDADRALDEIHQDYSTATALASALQRTGLAPTAAHGFVSALVDHGRSNGLRPSGLSYDVACRIFTDFAGSVGLNDKTFPLVAEVFHRSWDPAKVVREAKSLGGPQPAEVSRMLADHQRRIDEDLAWYGDRVSALERASRALAAAFDVLKMGPRP